METEMKKIMYEWVSNCNSGNNWDDESVGEFAEHYCQKKLKECMINISHRDKNGEMQTMSCDIKYAEVQIPKLLKKVIAFENFMEEYNSENELEE